MTSEQFREEEHPRKEDGTFTFAGQGNSSEKKEEIKQRQVLTNKHTLKKVLMSIHLCPSYEQLPIAIKKKMTDTFIYTQTFEDYCLVGIMEKFAPGTDLMEDYTPVMNVKDDQSGVDFFLHMPDGRNVGIDLKTTNLDSNTARTFKLHIKHSRIDKDTQQEIWEDGWLVNKNSKTDTYAFMVLNHDKKKLEYSSKSLFRLYHSFDPIKIDYEKLHQAATDRLPDFEDINCTLIHRKDLQELAFNSVNMDEKQLDKKSNEMYALSKAIHGKGADLSRTEEIVNIHNKMFNDNCSFQNILDSEGNLIGGKIWTSFNYNGQEVKLVLERKPRQVLSYIEMPVNMIQTYEKAGRYDINE